MKKLIIILAIVLSACSPNSDPLTRNHKIWNDANISHYRFELTVGCFCPWGGLMPWKVEVKDGEVVSMISADGTEFDTSDPLNEYVLRFATVDRIFERLDSEQFKSADKLEAIYDSTYGFPASVNIDFIELAMDDELYLTIAAFEPLP